MVTEQDTYDGVSRRAAMKLALKTGAYAAPAVLSMSAVVGRVAAATPPVILCAAGATSLSFFQDALLLGVFPGATFNVFAQPNTAAAATMIGSFTADPLGVAVGAFALPPPQMPLGTTSVTVSVFLVGSATASATFVSTLVSAIACTAGGQRQAAQLIAKVVQEATGCPAGNPNLWQETVDANLVNATPNAAYDIYIKPNNIVSGLFVPAGTITTNAQGNAGAILGRATATTGGNPTSVIVTAVPSGSPIPTAPSPLTFTAAPTGNVNTSTLITVNCLGNVSSAGTLASATTIQPVLTGVG